jgi:hypothetical protein
MLSEIIDCPVSVKFAITFVAASAGRLEALMGVTTASSRTMKDQQAGPMSERDVVAMDRRQLMDDAGIEVIPVREELDR